MLITHEMHVVRQICHRVAVMEEGRVVESGEVIEVFKNPQQPITKQFVGEERVDDEIDEVFHHLSTSLRPGGSSSYSVFRRPYRRRRII